MLAGLLIALAYMLAAVGIVVASNRGMIDDLSAANAVVILSCAIPVGLVTYLVWR